METKSAELSNFKDVARSNKTWLEKTHRDQTITLGKSTRSTYALCRDLKMWKKLKSNLPVCALQLYRCSDDLRLKYVYRLHVSMLLYA